MIKATIFYSHSIYTDVDPSFIVRPLDCTHWCSGSCRCEIGVVEFASGAINNVIGSCRKGRTPPVVIDYTSISVPMTVTK